MGDPVLHLIVGPNGSGKSTLYEKVIGPATSLEFINADVIAAHRWPDDAMAHSYDAARIASEQRTRMITERQSFVAETIFSHESKIELVRAAVAERYLVSLHVIMVPEDLAAARVQQRVIAGGHDIPEDKVRIRYRRLWPLVAKVIPMAEHAIVSDNSRGARPFRIAATFARGRLVGEAEWPSWAPSELTEMA